jgi:hypothetical protein
MMLRHVGTLFALAALACSTTPTGPSAFSGAAGLQPSASVNRSEIDFGQPVLLTLTLTNPTSDPITLHFNSCQVTPFVANLVGTVVVPSGGGWVCAASLSQVTIAPGASQTYTFEWAGSPGLATELPDLSRLPAGPYYFYARVNAREGTYTTARFLVTHR